MGCTPSKQPVCRNCNAQFSPVRRSYSMRRSYSTRRRHSPPHDADNHHVVALTSTTLGYLLVDPSTKPNKVCIEPVRRNAPEKKINDFALELIDEKVTKTVSKTPVTTPPGEPETINAWDLMEGLDDPSPFNPPSDNFDTKTINIKPLINEKLVKEKLVLYFTSLRGVRKTYEDCCHVRVILKNYGVRVDERDVSMHSGFKDELKELLGDQYNGGGLPKVFVGRRQL
ncbi:hypothetical protein L1987_71749 [Smallanthus sonchifolius]|uniref:Uncharacterized protein n=1 Tax=Smallanthus sonchifolius TaxID=185202 RepID=A0ACB9ATZ5_9ASTR|nr:hypothetical protein L1987_71749 [Smallanthus sonchifolius]